MESVGGGSVRALQPEPQLQAWTSWVPCRDDVCCTTPPHCLASVSHHHHIKHFDHQSIVSSLSPLSITPLLPLPSHRRQFAAPVVSRTPLRYQYASHPSIHPTSLIEQPYTRPAKPPSTRGWSCSVSHPTSIPAQAGNHTGGEKVHRANPIAAIASPQCPPKLARIPLALSSHPNSSLLPYSLSASP